VDDPKSLANDRLVLSKGHASPLMFSVLKAIGAITDEQLLTFREFGSPVQGHPVPVPDMPWIDVATGSLGQGLPIGFGMATAMHLDGLPGRVWVLMGDSESAEGSVWEAMEVASHYRRSNLVAILDMNRLGQRGPTMLQWDPETYAARARAFGWHAIEIDGHDVAAIDAAYREAASVDDPTFIVARTVKGWGVAEIADHEGWHGKALPEDLAREAIEELGGERSITITPPKPEPIGPVERKPSGSYERPTYDGDAATRKVFGETLAALAPSRPEIVVLDGEVANSTHTEDFEEVAPDRFVEVYIAEQCMLGAGVGLQALGKKAFAATFAAFLTRGYDFVRMGAISRAELKLCGSHAGVSIGEDGPSQMGLEDLAMMRAVQGSTVLYPADGNATARLVETMVDLDGISYIRTTREKTPKLYDAGEEFPVGGSKTVRSSGEDRATVVGAGITLFEALGAADQLAADGIAVRVIDAYSVKPIDAPTLRAALEETGVLVVVEDHWIEGGLGDAVLEGLAGSGDLSGRVVKVGVTEMAGSGSPEELRDWAGISASKIAQTVKTAIGK
jgi:transketolase